MDRNETNKFEFPDAMFNESIPEADTDGWSLSGDDELGSARIDEYRQEARQYERPLRAILGSAAAGLFDIASLSERALKDAIDSDSGKILDRPIQQGIRNHVNLVRQAESLAKFDARLEAAEQQAAKNKAQRMMAGVPGPARAKQR